VQCRDAPLLYLVCLVDGLQNLRTGVEFADHAEKENVVEMIYRLV
jgi:hypothetical protein